MNKKAKKKMTRKVAARATSAKGTGFCITRIAKAPEKVQRRRVHVVQAEVDLELFEAAKEQLTERGLHIRQLVTWAFESFLLTYDRKQAARLGVSA